jgi:hypothetical protein
MRAWRAVGGAALAGVFALTLLFSGYLGYLAVSAQNVPSPKIVAIKSGSGKATLSWAFDQKESSQASSVDHFVVYRSEQPGGPFQRVSESPAGALSFTDDNLSNGKTYYFAVASCDKRGNESEPSEASKVTPICAPTGCYAKGGERRITVRWNPVSFEGLASYAVYRNGTLVQKTKATSITDGNVRRGIAYTYTVRAVAGDGTLSGDSNRANARSFETCWRCGGDGKLVETCRACGGDGRTSASCWRCGGDGDCNTCGGYGGWYDWWGWWITCGTCGGDGDCNTCGGDGRITSTCSTCGGDGKIVKTCPTCKGRGRLT